MRTFNCNCGNRLYFRNHQCLQCGATLGFLPDELRVATLTENDDQSWSPLSSSHKRYHKCENYQTAHTCNWMVSENDNNRFCLACRLNEIIPDLDKPENPLRWYKLECDKRHLVYSLLDLQLPITSRTENQDNGLAFRFMEDIVEYNPYTEEIENYEKIVTGHDRGIITINIIEADDSEREANRARLSETYRTTLGHFRHEIGHYYWYELVDGNQRHDEFRALFGDERKDYQQSLSHYYANGPQADWPSRFISAYASAHPWEDWAESFAHYLHLTDLLETAAHHDIAIENLQFEPITNLHDSLAHADFNQLMIDLERLTIALNEMNRSLGFGDPYPFNHSSIVIDKLRFVHQVIFDVQPN